MAEATLTHRRRRHRADHLDQMETLLEELRSKGLVETEDVVLWKGRVTGLKSISTQKRHRLQHGNKCQSKNGIKVYGSHMSHLNIQSWFGLQQKID